MELTLKKLSLTNFKGIKSKEIEFGDITSISGQNATGKSTIADAFTWLLFGKDQFDRKDFEIKTLDKQGREIPRIDHNVTAVFHADGRKIVLSRTLKEKWEKPRGKSEQVFTGNETVYMVNEVVVSQSEYQNTINNIIREDLFKLLTVTGYFNSIKWQDRRIALTSIANIPTDEEIAGSEFKDILTLINEQYKTIINLKKAYATKKKGINDQLIQIPGRLDEAHKAMPEPKDFSAIEKQITELQGKVVLIDAQIADKSKAVQQAVEARSKQIIAKNNLETKINEIVYRARQEFSSQVGKKEEEIAKLQSAIRFNQRNIDDNNANAESKQRLIDVLKAENDNLRSEAGKINSLEFTMNEGDTVCVTCNQALPEETIGQLRETQLAKFIENKKNKLTIINTNGVSNKNKIEDYTNYIANLKAGNVTSQEAINKLQEQINQLAAAPSQLTTVEEILSHNPEYAELKKQLEAMVIPELTSNVDTTELTSSKFELNQQVDRLKSELNDKAIIEAQTKRIAEIEESERKLSQELADLEGVEFAADKFSKLKMLAVEQSVNKLFPTVRWRMFDAQINGGEAETCVCLVGGVPYSDANRAAQIHAGLEILNVFSNYHQITAPVWIDNAECCNKIPMPNGQLVALYVTDDKTLKVKSEAKHQQVA